MIFWFRKTGTVSKEPEAKRHGRKRRSPPMRALSENTGITAAKNADD
jgi:hypothetical protein